MESNNTQNTNQPTGFCQIVKVGKTLKLVKMSVGKLQEAIRSEFSGPPKSLAEALLA